MNPDRRIERWMQQARRSNSPEVLGKIENKLINISAWEEASQVNKWKVQAQAEVDKRNQEKENKKE